MHGPRIVTLDDQTVGVNHVSFGWMDLIGKVVVDLKRSGGQRHKQRGHH
jgi:hypothetical protein